MMLFLREVKSDFHLGVLGTHLPMAALAVWLQLGFPRCRSWTEATVTPHSE